MRKEWGCYFGDGVEVVENVEEEKRERRKMENDELMNPFG